MTSSSTGANTGTPDVSPVVEPLTWLLGKWRSVDAVASYPTMEPLRYEEELEFFHTGQPNIQFTFNSWHPDSKKPMHKETGFIRIDPNSKKIALIIAMNIGVCEIEEGTLEGKTIVTESKTVASISFGKEPRTKKISRTFRLDGDMLEQLVTMETSKTAEQQHLKASYKKL